jgi:hypothetical protein
MLDITALDLTPPINCICGSLRLLYVGCFMPPQTNIFLRFLALMSIQTLTFGGRSGPTKLLELHDFTISSVDPIHSLLVDESASF